MCVCVCEYICDGMACSVVPPPPIGDCMSAISMRAQKMLYVHLNAIVNPNDSLFLSSSSYIFIHAILCILHSLMTLAFVQWCAVPIPTGPPHSALAAHTRRLQYTESEHKYLRCEVHFNGQPMWNTHTNSEQRWLSLGDANAEFSPRTSFISN